MHRIWSREKTVHFLGLGLRTHLSCPMLGRKHIMNFCYINETSKLSNVIAFLLNRMTYFPIVNPVRRIPKTFPNAAQRWS